MALTDNQKKNLVKRLLTTKQQGQRAELTLLFQGKADEADDVRAATDAVSEEVDRLLGELMDEWAASAEDVRRQMIDINADLKARVRDIEAKKSVARNVVKIIGNIDKAVEVASAVFV